MCIVNCLFECLCTFLIPMYIVQKFIQKGKEYNGNSEQKFVVMVYFDFYSDHFSSSSYSFLFFYELDSILVGIASIALVYLCVFVSFVIHKSKNKTIEIPFILQKVCIRCV